MDFFNPIELNFLKKLVLERNPFETKQPEKTTFRDPIKDLNEEAESNNYLAKSKSNENLNTINNLDDKQIEEFLKSIQLDNKNPLNLTTTSQLNKPINKQSPINQTPLSQLNQPVTQQSNQPQPISQKSYINPEDLTDKELEEAQERSRKNELFALLSKAVNQFGSGLSGAIASGSGFGAIVPSTKASDEFSDQLLKLANRPVEDVLLKRKQEQEKIKTLTDKQKLELQQRLSDSNSDISKMARQLYEKAMGKKLPENVSAMDIQLAGFDSIVKALVDQETNKIRLEELKQDKIMKSDTKMAERLDKVEEKQKEIEQEYDKAYGLIDRALTDPEALSMLTSSLVKLMEGHSARVSDQDVKRALGVPNLKDIRFEVNKFIGGNLTPEKAKRLHRILNDLKQSNDKHYNELKENMMQKYVNIQKNKGRSEDEIRETFMMQKKKEEQGNQLNTPTIDNMVEKLLPTFKSQYPNESEEIIRSIIKKRLIDKFSNKR
jgi:hypothetical protein